MSNEGGQAAVLQNLLAAWEPYAGSFWPPGEPRQTVGRRWIRGLVSTYIGTLPAISSTDRDDGHKNHGYRRVKGEPQQYCSDSRDRELARVSKFS